ncbi:phage tail length tape measure family protein [Comamonas sp. CMM01]|uniref:phage tail length tape measure family protein n=1 Tax=Comamonas sp. CMM01 TaxID=2769280 RepID=UPI00177BCB24|nr:phage tail length tape measure family protein [Comamonas sp. CMM01]MBD9530455.1 phage tail length tape measure family protein [Comamonas sp. CMM01]
MNPIGIKMTLDGRREVSQGLQQVGNDLGKLGNAGSQLGGLSQGMGNAARTAGQLQQATQQLPMQFQDIVVSLQAGQAPLTVMLQQGSQLAGSFGGVGAAAKAMAGYVVGLINPLTLMAAGVATVGVAYYQGSKEQSAWVEGIVTTGNASGVTTSQLREYARAIDSVVGTQRQAAAGLADFVDAGVRGGDSMRRYTEAAVMWERATGQAVSKTAKQFADLQGAPLEAVLKLNQGTNFLTVSVYEQIKALESQGRSADASRVAMDALESSMRDRAKQIEENLGYIERGWRAIKEAAADGWDAMLNVGRPASLQDQLSVVEEKLATALKNQSWSETDGGAATGRVNTAYVQRVQANIKALQDQKFALMDAIDAEQLNAAAKAESTRQMQAREAFDNKYSKALEAEVTLQQKLTKARAEAEAAGKTEADIKKVLAFVTEEHNKSLSKGGAAAKQAQTSYESLLSTINQKIVAMQNEVTAGKKLTETETLRAKLQEELETKGRQYSARQRADLEARLQVLDAVEKQAIAAKALAKANEDDAKSLERLNQQRENSLKSVQQALRTAQDEEEAARLAAASNISNGQAIALVAAARAEDAYMQAVANGEAPRTLDFLEKEMQARRKLVEVMGQRGVREANEKSAKDAAKEWEKVSQTIGDTLADYIMAGGTNAATYLKRLFSTLVLQPIVKAGVAGLIGGASSAAAAASTSGGTGLIGALQSGQTLWSAFSGGLSGSLAAGIGSVGSMLGSSFLGELASGIAAGGQLGIGGTASLMGSAGGTTGFGMAIGAAAPWIAGIAAIATLAKALDNGGTPHVGAGAVYDDGALTGDRSTVNVNQAKNWSGTTQTGISSLASTLGGMFDGLAKAFGQSTGWRVETGFSGDGDDKSRGLLSISDANGIAIAGWGGKSGRYSSNVEKAWGQYLEEVSGSTLVALRNIAPAWGDAIIDGATAELDKLSGTEKFQAIAELAQQIAATKAQLAGLGDAMAMFKDMTDAVETTLLSVSGGIESLVANAGQFYDLYYSDAEKQARSLAQLQEVFTKYGADLPNTREEYRALVEAQMAAGESGAEFAAVLLGLSSQFAGISDTWASELASMAKSVDDLFAGLKDSIAAAQSDVAASRKDILRGSDAMTAEEIAAAIAAINTVGPSMAGVNAAGDATASAAAAAAQAQAVRDAYAAAAGQQQSTLGGLQTQRSDAQAQIDAAKKNADDTQAWAMDQWLRRRGSHSYRKYTVTQIRDDAQAAYERTLLQMTGVISGLDAAIAQQQGVYDDAAAAAKAYADQLAAAQAVLAATQQAQVQAQVDYAAAMKDWVVEAGSSVSKLSELRGEVVDFYEAQAAAVQAMLQSAGNLRSVVDQVRLGQLDTAQTAAELGKRYATDYAMALATTGTTRAGYVDAMAGNLQGLSEALKAEAATGADWRIQTAKLLAQASNAADLLEGDAEADNYQDVALGLLDSIDTALESLSAATVSAEQVIADAINAGTAAQLAGLRAIVAALKGEQVPAFAAGGYHLGGLRLVGENGPELEATGPSRIWNAQQTLAFLGGGGGASTARLEALIARLIEESRVQASATIRIQQDIYRLMMFWETQGPPAVREAA